MDHTFYRPRRTPEGSGEHRRETRSLSPDPLARPSEAVSELVERVCKAHGGAKALAGEIPVGYAQIRRWVGDGGLPGLDDLLLLMRLAGPHDPFRGALIDHLLGMFTPTPADLAAAVERRVSLGKESIAEAVLHELDERERAR